MKNPIPQTPEELERECLGTIANVARDIERAAMESKPEVVKTQMRFLKVQMERLETIRGTVGIRH